MPLKFLFDFVGKAADVQVRVKWERGTVMVGASPRTFPTVGSRFRIYSLIGILISQVPFQKISSDLSMSAL